jgi:hypothetical protein
MTPPRQPTSEECTAHAHLGDGWYAIWYPQMGGYVATAAIKDLENDGCFNAFIWHDGQFPFDEPDLIEEHPSRRKNPAFLHHCSSEQFIQFGEEVRRIQGEAKR